MTIIPRPAATVVLIDDLFRVYLTKRPETMKFMGGFYVFPGGSVDKDDYTMDHGRIKHLNSNESFDSAHYVAAARELFEEVGILVCKRDDGSAVYLEADTAMEYRRLLLKGEMSFLQLLKKEGLQFQLNCLAYFGQIITPNVSPIRFDTRFFLTELPKYQSPQPDLNEISDALWISPADALSDYQKGKISLAPPTIHALKTIMNYQEGSPLMMPDFRLSDYKSVF